ncbi:MAG: iron-containing alcohol dehydrogenase [Gammaproteobacteria bacterium]|nr:iron-containing alcohol dehydrogenase [Gammaproteobacteria bacterium]
MPDTLKLLLHNLQLLVLKIVMKLVSAGQPLLFSGPGSSLRMCRAMADLGARKVLIVTDAVLVKLGLIGPLREALEAHGVACTVYDGVEPDPTHRQIEAGVALARRDGCDAVLAVGGGSPMDAAKIIAACVANTAAVSDLVGNFRIKQAPLPIYAIPTTAGTGSEVTVVAVVTDTAAQAKTPVVDGKLVPLMAALDAALMTGLPPHISAATGMDALTHAVESYLSRFANDSTMRLSLAAAKLVFANLARVCEHGEDLEARQAMAMASTYAGLAFSRASVGYVHAIAHNLGGIYHTPHGLANAIVLPHILDFSRDAAAARLADLALAIGAGTRSESAAVLAERFIAKVRELALRIGIPEKLDTLRAADVPLIARRALDEAQGFYPVPRFMNQSECEAVLRKLLP